MGAYTTSGIIRNISNFPEPWGIWVSTGLKLNCHSVHDQLLLHLPGLRETFPYHQPHQAQGVPLLGDAQLLQIFQPRFRCRIVTRREKAHCELIPDPLRRSFHIPNPIGFEGFPQQREPIGTSLRPPGNGSRAYSAPILRNPSEVLELFDDKNHRRTFQGGIRHITVMVIYPNGICPYGVNRSD